MGWAGERPKRVPSPWVYVPSLPASYVLPTGLVANSQAAAASNTAALQSAASEALLQGKALVIPNGTYYHDDAITFDSIAVIGSGNTELIGTDGSTTPNCALILTGTAPQLVGVRASRNAAARGSANDEAGVLVSGATGFLVEYVTTVRAASSGIFVSQSSGGIVRRSSVLESYADGVHITDASSDVDVEDCTVHGSGDDYFAVVSYIPQGEYCSDIRFRRCIGSGQVTTGRGLTVVGGKNITYSECRSYASLGHGFYVASEGSYDTFGTSDILFEDCLSIGSVGDGCRVTGRAGAVGSGPYASDSLTSARIAFVRCSIDGAGDRGASVLAYSVDVSLDVSISNTAGSGVEFQGVADLSIKGSMRNIGGYGVVAGVSASSGRMHAIGMRTHNIGTAGAFYDVFNLAAALCDGMDLLIEGVVDTRDAAYGERFLESTTTTGGTVRNCSSPRSSSAAAWTFE